MSATLQAMPTVYRGRRYRSRLEARWAAFFGQVGWPYEYEPFDLARSIPDFVLLGAKRTILVEIKPITCVDQAIADKTECAPPLEQEALLVGALLQSWTDWWPRVGWLWQVCEHGYKSDPLTGAPCPPAGWQQAPFTICDDNRQIDFYCSRWDTEEFGDGRSGILHAGRLTGGTTSCCHGPSHQEFSAKIERACEAGNSVQCFGRAAL